MIILEVYSRTVEPLTESRNGAGFGQKPSDLSALYERQLSPFADKRQAATSMGGHRL